MNPYKAPSADANEAQPSPLKSIVLYWEKMRLLYNVILGGIGILTILLTDMLNYWPIAGLLGGAIIYGIAANLVYSLGPYLNIVGVTIFEMNTAPWRPLFYLGLIFSAVLTFVLCWASSLPLI